MRSKASASPTNYQRINNSTLRFGVVMTFISKKITHKKRKSKMRESIIDNTDQKEIELSNLNQQYNSTRIQEDVTQNQIGVLLKQYELLVNLLDSEMGRSWSRFNIFIGLQSAAIIGVIVSLKTLLINIFLFRMIIILFGSITLLYSIIIFRGILTQTQFFNIIADLESKSFLFLPIIQLSKKHSKLPQYINNLITFVISLLFLLVWIFVFVFLENPTYKLISP